MTDKELLQQALAALRSAHKRIDSIQAIAVLEEECEQALIALENAIAQPVQLENDDLTSAYFKEAQQVSLADSLQVDAAWQAFCRTADYQKCLRWAEEKETPGALFVAFRSGLNAIAQPVKPDIDSFIKSVTDPENQPSQYGTVTLDFHFEKIKEWEDKFDREIDGWQDSIAQPVQPKEKK